MQLCAHLINSLECTPFFKDFIYLFMRYRERGRDIGRGRSRLHTGNLMWNSIPDPELHAEPKVDAQRLSHPGVPGMYSEHSILTVEVHCQKIHRNLFFFFLRFYLFIHERHREQQRHRQKSLPEGNLMQYSIPGPQDHDLSQRQKLNH